VQFGNVDADSALPGLNHALGTMSCDVMRRLGEAPWTREDCDSYDHTIPLMNFW
jgi:hypothetical protein